jgi:anti-sigma regulatory factor (Ser/Thr protein kinase)
LLHTRQRFQRSYARREQRVPPYYEPSKSFTIRNEIGELEVLRAGLNRFCADNAVAQNTVTQLQVVLDEIVSNVIKYAWPEGGAHELSVTLTAGAHSLQMEVVDDGRAFNPLTAPAPQLDVPGSERRPGGVGIHITKQLVDDIAYFREDDCNHILLTKRFDRGVMDSQEN